MKTESLGTDSLLAEIVEEITGRIQVGEGVQLEQYIQQHPEQADQLRRVWPALEALAGLPFSGSAGPPTLDQVPYPRDSILGDFRILREVGRGGMGIVYEAEQISLARPVALKVLPFAAALEAKQLQRFKNEAQAAAHLHHTNIVPVYSVGCERGVHYYAMQFIEGRTLAMVIRELGEAVVADAETRRHGDTAKGSGSASPRPHVSATTVANWGVQAAEALEYAHAQGIIHRDIKPANLLIDAEGKLWITDFGLARCQDEAGLTLTGDLVGTLRYMSPEQAQGKRAVVDHRADIYSLGVTLYEALTLRPAMDGSSRQEVMHQVCFEEPPSPRRLSRSIPVEMETILLKAINKTPESRYGSAQELADDLRRFLTDRPILARRPSLVERLVKWGRRHPAIVTAGTGALLIAVACLTATTILVERAYRQEALQRQEAQDNFEHAVLQQQRAQEKEKEADAQRLEAERNFQSACDAVDQLLSEVAATHLYDVPQMDGVRRSLLEKALAFYQGLLQEKSSDPAVRSRTAKVYARVSHIHQELGQLELSVREMEQAQTLYRQLADEFPSRIEHRRNLAIAHRALAARLHENNQGEGAERESRAAIALMQRVIAEAPVYRKELADCFNTLGVVLASRNDKDAEDADRQSLAIYEELAREAPDKSESHVQLAAALNNLALHLRKQGRFQESLPLAERALEHQQEALRLKPNDRQSREFLAKHYNLRMGLLLDLKKLPEAERAWKQYEDAAQQLIADFPTSPEYRSVLASNYNDYANFLERVGRAHQAEEVYFKSLRMYEKLIAEFPSNAKYRRNPGGIWHNVAAIRRGLGRMDESLRAYDEAVEIKRRILADEPSSAPYRHTLALSYMGRGVTLREMSQYSQAEETYQNALAILEPLSAENHKTADYRRDTGSVLNNLAMVLRDRGEWELARRTIERAIAYQRAALDLVPNSIPIRQNLRSHLNILLDSLLRLGKHREAAEIPAERLRLFPNRPDEYVATAKSLFLCVPLAEEDNDPAAADRYAARAKQALADVLKQRPSDFMANYELAFFLARTPAARFRDPVQAIDLLRPLLKHSPENSACWHLLGAAFYRQEKWEEALLAMEQSMALHREPFGGTYYYLAMMHWKLGNRSEAQRYFQRGDQIRSKSKLHAEGLKGDRAEAAAVLGIATAAGEP